MSAGLAELAAQLERARRTWLNTGNASALATVEEIKRQLSEGETELATLRARHAQLCEQINEEATPFREAPLPVACAERDRLWEHIQELEPEDDE